MLCRLTGVLFVSYQSVALSIRHLEVGLLPSMKQSVKKSATAIEHIDVYLNKTERESQHHK